MTSGSSLLPWFARGAGEMFHGRRGGRDTTGRDDLSPPSCATRHAWRRRGFGGRLGDRNRAGSAPGWARCSAGRRWRGLGDGRNVHDGRRIQRQRRVSCRSAPSGRPDRPAAVMIDRWLSRHLSGRSDWRPWRSLRSHGGRLGNGDTCRGQGRRRELCYCPCPVVARLRRHRLLAATSAPHWLVRLVSADPEVVLQDRRVGDHRDDGIDE
jgi:hypothetical protein